MAKIFISFLGTNDYLPCVYEYQAKRIENVRFVQEATIRLNCMEWSSNDRVVIFTTEKAFRANWKDNGHKDSQTKEMILQDGLESRIQKINGGFSCRQVHIPDGKNEKEIWDIFLKVFETIQEKDEIIFDITHAFRSIPMLAVVILNYARIMKQVTLKGIYYGALEALGSLPEARRITPERRIVPILDLTAFDQLMEWSAAADRFLGAGDASQLSKIANNSARLILSETKGNDRSQHTIRRMAENLEQFTKTLSTCRGRNISHVVERLKQNLEECKSLKFNNPLNAPLKTVLGKIGDQINRFPGHFIKDGIQAARWCLEHNLVQQSYTILQEMLITYFIYQIGEDPGNFKNKNIYRTLANQGATISFNNLSFDQWKKEAKEHPGIMDKFMSFYKTQPELLKVYVNLTGYRNDFNHAGFNVDDRPAEKFSREMPGFLEIVEKHIRF